MTPCLQKGKVRHAARHLPHKAAEWGRTQVFGLTAKHVATHQRALQHVTLCSGPVSGVGLHGGCTPATNPGSCPTSRL